MISTEEINLMRTCASYNKKYHTYVEVSFIEVFCGDPIKNHNLVSEAATGSELMEDLEFQVVDRKGSDTLVLAVSGKVNKVVEELSAWQLQGE